MAQWLDRANGNRLVASSNRIGDACKAISFTSLCQCLSEETQKAVGPFYKNYGVYARGSKRSHTGGKYMCNLPWTQ